MTFTNVNLLDSMYYVSLNVVDEFKNPVIFEQPVVLSLVGQGQQIFSTFTALNSSSYTASYTIQSGDLERSKCGTYTLSNFLLINGGL